MLMPRGVVPRQPARTGRQDKIRTAQAAVGRHARVGMVAAQKERPKPPSAAAGKNKGYDPLAPERVTEILRRLDQLYPAVTCALTHSSAWELLVATILSAQSTDANVNRVTPELFHKYPTV